MKFPNLEEEKFLWKQGLNFVVGLDEAGRGPLAGPVVAGAVLLSKDFIMKKEFTPLNAAKRQSASGGLFNGVNDSKKLSEKQRNYFYKILTNHKDIEWGIGIVSEKVIDKINILEATKLAMQKALRQAQGKPKRNVDYLLIDGNFSIKSDVPQKSIIRGDQKVISISAASIIAKVTRDRIMENYDKKYPQYGFKKHKGYPTEFHRQRIKEFGLCRIHRMSFHSS